MSYQNQRVTLQEIVRILKASRNPKDNLSGAERRALRALQINADPTVLPADKGNVAVVLNTRDYNRKIAALFGAPKYRKLPKDPTEAMEQKTPSFSRTHRFLRRSSNSCGHRVRGLLDYMGSQRSTSTWKVPPSGPSSAPSAPQPTTWPSIWLSSSENTWGTLHDT
jgi:hypothetical protein